MLKPWATELWMIRTVSAFILSKHVFLLSFSYVPFFPSLLKASFSFRELYLFRPCLYPYHLPPVFIFIKNDRKMELKYVLFGVVYGDLRRIKRCLFLFLIFFHHPQIQLLGHKHYIADITIDTTTMTQKEKQEIKQFVAERSEYIKFCAKAH
jgi:hypothetical protein